MMKTQLLGREVTLKPGQWHARADWPEFFSALPCRIEAVRLERDVEPGASPYKVLVRNARGETQELWLDWLLLGAQEVRS